MRPGFDPWVRKIPWRREWQPTPVFLPGESHGQRSRVGYRPWGCKESETTERLTHGCFRASLVAQLVKNPSAVQEIWVRFLDSEDPLEEELHSNSLQYSCLENSHGQRSLADYSPWDCQESDTTERLSLTHAHTHGDDFSYR